MNQIIEVNKMDELITYNITDVTLQKMRKEYLELTVNGLDDKSGYQKCHNARMVVKDHRVEVEKRRKELKSESLEFGRKVDQKAKEITCKLAEIEDHLQSQQDVIDNEKKRQEEEKARKLKERLDERLAMLQKYRAEYSIGDIALLTDEAFEEVADKARSDYLAAEQERKAEKERLVQLKSERIELEQQIQKQEAENKRIRDELEAKQRSEIAEKEKQLAEERTAREKERQERLEADKAEDARRAIEEKKRQEVETARELKRQAEEKEKAEIARQEEAKRKVAEMEKRLREAETARKIANETMFEEIKNKFTTIESAWIEIARLRKLMNGGK